MELKAQFKRLNSGEHNSRVLDIIIDEEHIKKKVKLGFVTPMGKVFITDELQNGLSQLSYGIPFGLLDGKGILLAQIIVYEDEGFILKSSVYEFPVYASVDDMTCPQVTPEGAKSLVFLYDMLMNKAERIHEHNDIYYTEDEVDGLLSGKSDNDHKHDDRYYVDVQVDALLAGKSDSGHKHDDRYYTKEQADNKLNGSLSEGLSGKSDKGHMHSWTEIGDKPGTEGMQLLCSFVCDYLTSSGLLFGNPWIQQFEPGHKCDFVSGEVLQLRIKLPDSDTVLTEDCRFIYLPEEGFALLTYNNAKMTEEDLLAGKCNITSIYPIDKTKPAFFLLAYNNEIIEVDADDNYTGVRLELGRVTCVKLPSSAVEVTDEVAEGNKLPVTSQGVYDALKRACKVDSVNGKTGAVELTASDVNALPADTVIPAVPENVSAFSNDAGYITKEDIPGNVSAFSNDAGYITAEALEGLAPSGGGAVSSVNGKTGAVSLTASDVNALPADTVIPAVPENVSAFSNDAGYITKTDIPGNVSSFNNDAGYITEAAVPGSVSAFNNDIGYITKNDIPVNISEFTNDAEYMTQEQLAQAIESCEKPFVVKAAADMETLTLISSDKTVEEIAAAHSMGYHVFMDLSVDGLNVFLELRVISGAAFAGFQSVVVMDEPTFISLFMLSDNSSSVHFYHFAEADHTHSYSDITKKAPITLTSSDDLDNIFDDGIYVYSTSSVPGNAPFANAAVVEVFGADSVSTQKIQRAYRYGAAGYCAFRQLYNSTWGEWMYPVSSRSSSNRPVSDYTVEEGTSGGWKYRKWFSGRMEAWGNLNASVTEIFSNTGVYGTVVITAQVKFPAGMLTGEDNVEYCALQARNYQFFGNMSGISSNNLWGRFTGASGVESTFPVGNTEFPVHAYITGRWK